MVADGIAEPSDSMRSDLYRRLDLAARESRLSFIVAALWGRPGECEARGSGPREARSRFARACARGPVDPTRSPKRWGEVSQRAAGKSVPG